MIPISSNPTNNNTTSNTAMFQDWAPLPNPYTTNVVYYPALGVPIVEEEILFQQKDAIGQPIWAGYPLKRLVGMQTYGTNNPIAWLNPSCYTGLTYPNGGGAQPITNNSTFHFTPDYQNLNLLPAGVYTFSHIFIIQGFFNNQWWNLDAYIHNLRLTVSNSTVTFTPTNFIMSHTVGNALPTQVINMGGLAWKVYGNPKIVISSPSMGVTIQSITDASGTYQTVSGTGTGNFTITLTDFYDQPGTFDPALLTHSLEVSSLGTPVGFINFTIQVFDIPGLSVAPDTLSFYASRGLYEAAPQNVVLRSTAAVTITASPWLLVSQSVVVEDGVGRDVIVVAPISSTNFNLGTYTGFVQVDATISGALVTRTIAVTHIVDDLISSPYAPGKHAFTLDNKEFVLSSQNQDCYVEVNAEITTFDFFTDEQRVTTLPQKFVLFKNQAKFSLGKTIHQLMDKFDSVNNQVLQYKPAILKLNCVEKSNLDDTVIKNITLADIEFVAGLDNGTLPFLTYNPLPNRATINSIAFLNLLLPIGNFRLKITRNQTVSYTALPYSFGKIISHKVDFTAYNQGDVIKFEVEDINVSLSSLRPFVKTFLMLPIGKHSNQLIWEDEFLLKSALECTGDFKIQTDIQFDSNELFKNLEKVLEHLDVSRTTRFTVNTGWLLKSDIDTVTSLMESKRVWLQGATKKIALRPLTKSQPILDSTQDLIDYTIEFQINQEHGKETYSSQFSN